MPDNLDRIEKRLDAIEERMSRLETGKNKEVEPNEDKSEDSHASDGAGSPFGSIILLALGGIVLWNSLPNIFYKLFFYNSYNSYGRSYLDFGTILFTGLGAFLFSLGLRGVLKYRSEKAVGSKPAAVKTSGLMQSASHLELKNERNDVVSKDEASGDSIEYQIASHWFSIVGVVAILLGVALFLKFAFDNNWIGPAGQVSIGVIFGIFFLGVGDYFRTKYAQYSQVLSGCGIGILYLSLWAAYAIFKLIDPIVVLGAMSLVTAATALLAIRYNSIYLAILGIVGGFITPVLLAKGFDQVLLLSYILILNLGVLMIAFFKNWRSLNLITFAATYIDFSVWYATYSSKDGNFLEAFVFLTIVFIIFSFVWVVYNLVYNRDVEEPDILLTLLNAFVYFGFSLALLNNAGYKDYMGFFAFGMAVYYAIFGYLALSKFKADSVLTLGFLGTSILFLTVAVPLQVDRNLITVVWAIEGAVLVWLSFWISSYKLRVAALGIYILVAIRLVGFDANLPLDQFVLILNKRFLTYTVAAISTAIASYLYFTYRVKMQEDEKPVLPALLIAFNVVLVAALTLESLSYFDVKIKDVRESGNVSVLGSRTVSLPIASAADDYSVNCSIYSANEVYIGVDDACQTYWPIKSYFVFKNLSIPTGSIISDASLSLYAADNTDTPLTVKISSVQNPENFRQVALTNWTFLSPYQLPVTNLVTDAVQPGTANRQITFVVEPVAATSYRRVFAFERGDPLRVAKLNLTYQDSTNSVGGTTDPYVNPKQNVQTNTYQNNNPYKAPDPKVTEAIRSLENKRNISISIIWLVYSLVLLMAGVAVKYKPIRLSALVFFAITILKVFLVDSSSLQQLYRIFAFIGLGTILLVVAYIYQRYKQQINAFLLNG